MNGYFKRILLLFFIQIFAQNTHFAQNAQASFIAANEAFKAGKYEEAIKNYEDILAAGKYSTTLYYNLANAYYLQNELAPAIYYYEKALLSDGNNAMIKNNLQLARTKVRGETAIENEHGLFILWKKFRNLLTPNGWAISVLALLFSALIGYALWLFSTQKRLQYIGLSVFLFGLLTCFFPLWLAIQQSQAIYQSKTAIVWEDDTPLHGAADEQSPTNKKLFAGAKLYITDTLNNWYKVQTMDGEEGWVLSKTCRPL